jgi:sugar lactone lactonase YvrE
LSPDNKPDFFSEKLTANQLTLIKETKMKNLLLTLAAMVIIIITNQKVFSQPTVEVFATGFVNPIGIDIDANGNLWVAEQGSGSGNTSKISVVTPNGQVYPFLIDLPSSMPAFEPTGAQDVFLDVDGKVLVAQSKNTAVDTLEERILVVDPAGWVPGDPALNRSSIVNKIQIGASLSDSNPYKIEVGPNDDWFVIDAGGNCIFRRERSSGTISVFSTFSPVGQSEAVPTGLVYTGSNFYVSILTGLPIPIGAAKVYDVDLSGSKTIYQDGLTALVDVAINPVDNSVYTIQHGEMGPPWINSKGRLFRIQNGVVDTLISEMPRPAGMVFAPNGDLYLTTLQDANILKISNLPVGVEDENNFVADDFSLEQNYPNPFNPSTSIQYRVSSTSNVSLKVYDVLGNDVATLVNEEKPAGSYEVKFNAAGLSSGIYFYKLQAGSLIETKKMILMK